MLSVYTLDEEKREINIHYITHIGVVCIDGNIIIIIIIHNGTLEYQSLKQIMLKLFKHILF
jgi:hypothetical protein